jgi:hypothetical protein
MQHQANTLTRKMRGRAVRSEYAQHIHDYGGQDATSGNEQSFQQQPFGWRSSWLRSMRLRSRAIKSSADVRQTSRQQKRTNILIQETNNHHQDKCNEAPQNIK